MAQIRIDHLVKRFGELTVLRDIDLDIKDGEFLTLLGGSGCGKSTLLRIIAGLEDASEGTIQVDGERVNDVRPRDRNMAMVFQSYALYPHLSVYDNIAMPIKMRAMNSFERLPLLGRYSKNFQQKKARMDEAVLQVADLLDIRHLLDRKPSDISGGQRQRVALGRAMVRKPSAFLMDEPLSNLDAKLRVYMRTEIAALHRKLGATFIYVTHDQAEAMTMSDRIALMIDGRLMQIATPKEIYNNPNHIQVAEFIGSPRINLLPGYIDPAGTIIACGKKLPVEFVGEEVQEIHIGVRPELFSPVIDDSFGWDGEVAHFENLGSYYLIYVQLLDMEEPVIVRIGVTAVEEPVLGASIRIGAPLDRFFYFAETGERMATPRINASGIGRPEIHRQKEAGHAYAAA